MSTIWYEEPTDSEIKEHYGLDPHEWTGSLADRVMAVVNKNAPEKETHVNALLRDGARLFAHNMQIQQASGIDASDVREMVASGGDELRAAISDASWAGVLINDEAMEAIKYVEKEYITEFGGDSLTHAYDQMRKLNDARAHYREATKEMRTAAPAAPTTPSFDRFAPPQGARVTTVPSPVRTVGSARSAQPVSPVPPIPQPPKTPGSQVRTGGPVRVGNVAKDWLASHGRDEKGRPLASALASEQSQRSGSIQASLPGSGVTVGRSTPRVPPTARRMGVPESQVQAPSVDDGFEL